MNTRILTLKQLNGVDDDRYYVVNYSNSQVFNVFSCNSLIGQVASLEEATQLIEGYRNTLLGEYYE